MNWDEDPWRLAETPQSHEIAMKQASEMTDDELEARIRELDTALGHPLLELKPISSPSRFSEPC